MSDGDFDVETTEWRELPSSSQQVPEDWGHFPFNQGRQFNFQHKRTSMLFIGPKNAPTAQKQYALTDKSGGGFGLSSLSSVVFLIVSKFEEIPFSDCFKVLQYWVLEKGSRPDTTRVALGVGLHFNKSTMMRGKIESGAKEEMVTQARRVLASMVGSVQSGGKAAAPSKVSLNPSYRSRTPEASQTVSTQTVTQSVPRTDNIYHYDSYRWLQIAASVAVICGTIAMLAR